MLASCIHMPCLGMHVQYLLEFEGLASLYVCTKAMLAGVSGCMMHVAHIIASNVTPKDSKWLDSCEQLTKSEDSVFRGNAMFTVEILLIKSSANWQSSHRARKRSTSRQPVFIQGII